MSYVLYGPDPSAFTRKLEAALVFYGAPFARVREIGEERAQLQLRAGTHQVPVLRTPENWVLADSTPIMALLDGRFPRRRLFPLGAVGFLTHVLEDVLAAGRTMVGRTGKQVFFEAGGAVLWRGSVVPFRGGFMVSLRPGSGSSDDFRDDLDVVAAAAVRAILWDRRRIRHYHTPGRQEGETE